MLFYLTFCPSQTRNAIGVTNRTTTCHSRVRTIRCNDYFTHIIRITSAFHTCDATTEYARLQMATAISLTMCQFHFTNLPTGKAPGSDCNVSVALGGLQRCVLYVSILNFRSLFQMHILIEYKISTPLPSGHTRCSDNYMILPQQKVSMIPRCTVTK